MSTMDAYSFLRKFLDYKKQPRCKKHINDLLSFMRDYKNDETESLVVQWSQAIFDSKDNEVRHTQLLKRYLQLYKKQYVRTSSALVVLIRQSLNEVRSLCGMTDDTTALAVLVPSENSTMMSDYDTMIFPQISYHPIRRKASSTFVQLFLLTNALLDSIKQDTRDQAQRELTVPHSVTEDCVVSSITPIKGIYQNMNFKFRIQMNGFTLSSHGKVSINSGKEGLIYALWTIEILYLANHRFLSLQDLMNSGNYEGLKMISITQPTRNGLVYNEGPNPFYFFSNPIEYYVDLCIWIIQLHRMWNIDLQNKKNNVDDYLDTKEYQLCQWIDIAIENLNKLKWNTFAEEDSISSEDIENYITAQSFPILKNKNAIIKVIRVIFHGGSSLQDLGYNVKTLFKNESPTKEYLPMGFTKHKSSHITTSVKSVTHANKTVATTGNKRANTSTGTARNKKVRKSIPSTIIDVDEDMECVNTTTFPTTTSPIVDDDCMYDLIDYHINSHNHVLMEEIINEDSLDNWDFLDLFVDNH